MGSQNKARTEFSRALKLRTGRFELMMMGKERCMEDKAEDLVVTLVGAIWVAERSRLQDSVGPWAQEEGVRC